MRGRGLDLRPVQTFVCLYMSVSDGLGAFCLSMYLMMMTLPFSSVWKEMDSTLNSYLSVVISVLLMKNQRISIIALKEKIGSTNLY